MRLNADDCFDESTCPVMVAYLNQHKEGGLVYPNYVYVDQDDQFMGPETLKK